jgi:hypothetical protein
MVVPWPRRIDRGSQGVDSSRLCISFFTCQFSDSGLAFEREGGGLDETLLKRAKQSVLIG